MEIIIVFVTDKRTDTMEIKPLLRPNNQSGAVTSQTCISYKLLLFCWQLSIWLVKIYMYRIWGNNLVVVS